MCLKQMNSVLGSERLVSLDLIAVVPLSCCTYAPSPCQIISVPNYGQCNHSAIQNPFHKNLHSKCQGCASKPLHIGLEVRQKIN